MKEKIKTILPYWLGCLLVFCALIAATPGGNPRNSTAGGVSPAGQPLVLGASTQARGQQPENVSAPFKRLEPDLSGISAKAFLVYDEATGETLLEKNPDETLSIASLTKLLTALVAYKQMDLNDKISVKEEGLIKTSPVLRLAPGDEVRVQDLFSAMIVGSANDAAGVLAGAVEEKTQKDFVDLMNEQARALGMAASRFSNPLGFESKYNYSTANDVKKMVQATQKLAAFSNLGRSASYEFSGQGGKKYYIKATNKLILKHADLEAIKTGYTDASKGSMAIKAARNGRKLVVIVLNSPDREKDSMVLADEAFKSFVWK